MLKAMALHTYVINVQISWISNRKNLTMANPFDYVNSILLDKKNMMRGSENDTMAEAGYNPWLTNTSLSYHEDTVLVANLVNQLSHLPHRAQYEILINIVRPKKRQFKKWVKGTVDEDLDVVCEIYQCNKTIGKEYLSLLTQSQLESLREQRQKGGT